MAEGGRKSLRELFIRCPLGTELEDCPARELRKLAAEDQARIVAGVTPEVVERLLGYHQACLARRTGGLQDGIRSVRDY